MTLLSLSPRAHPLYKVSENRKALAAKIALLDKIEGTYKKVEDLVKKEGFADLNSFLAELNAEETTEKKTRAPRKEYAKASPELMAALKKDTDAGMKRADILTKHNVNGQTYDKYKSKGFVFEDKRKKK